MTLKFDFKNSNISQKTYNKYKKKLEEETKALKKATKTGYEDPRCSINLPFDKSIISDSEKVLKKIKQPKTIIVIGIGGSNLGTIDVYEAIKGKRYNETNKKQVYFADTVDSDSMLEIKNLIEQKLKKKEKILLNAISKSGSTTETIANFTVLLNTIKKYDKDYKNHVVIITDKDSPFYNYAQKQGFHILTIPKNVGGRYSVISNVGIFPLMFLDINVKQLIKGAQDAVKLGIANSVNKNSPMKSAISIYEHNKKGRNIFNTFLFSTKMESVGKWYRQLLAESIGKIHIKNRKKFHTGLTPVTSIGSTDLHSMAQLYLAGPNDKYHCFINIKNNPKIKITNNKPLSEIVQNIQGKNLSEIIQAIYGGVTEAFKKKKRPFYEIEIEKIDEYNLGQLLQMKMIEVMYLGALFEVNPFDQPNVEEYKKITREILLNQK